MKSMSTLIALVAISSTAWADEGAREIPAELAPVLEEAEAALSQSKPDQAIAALEAYQGPEDALHALMLGHAYADRGLGAKAEASYRRAAKLDVKLKAARLGLVRILVDRTAWREAATLLGETVDIETAPAGELALYARVAYELRDLRLASLILDRGVVRFPANQRLRRLDLAVLAERGDDKRAFQAAFAFLAKNPDDLKAWRHLAAIAQDSEDEDLRLAALEAATLANPEDPRLRRSHAVAQLQAGHHIEALKSAEVMMANAPKDRDVTELAIRIAEAAGELGQARRWLNKVPMKRRSDTLHLLDARVALREKDPAAAGRALQRLIESGKATGPVLVWAARIAEQRGDTGQAEALYQQSRDMGGPSARIAVLHLARLLHRIGQPERAGRILATYLAKNPDDTPAQSLMAVIGSSRRSQP